MATTKVIQLIYTEEKRGNGTNESPFERIPCLFTLSGKQVARKSGFGEKIVEFYPQNLDDIL